MAKHGAEVFSAEVVGWQEELELALVSKDLNPLEKEVLEEALVQFDIEAFLHESEDHVIEIDSRVEPIRLKLVFDADERKINVVLLEILNEDNINRFEDI